jgi:hypothetical protein
MMAPRFLNLELGAVALAGASSFVEVHIWSPAYTYYLLLLLVALEVVVNGYLNKRPLRPRNLALRLLAYTVILGFAHGFAEHEKGLFFLSQLALAPFVIVHMRRLIIALGKLDLVDSDVADLLQKRIGKAAEATEEPAAPVPAEDSSTPTPAS